MIFILFFEIFGIFYFLQFFIFQDYSISFQINFQETVNSPITYVLKHVAYMGFGSNWSSMNKDSDSSKEYAIVKYTEYASSLEEFVEKYPYFIVVTNGEASCDQAFDVGYNKFGTLSFETKHFIQSNGKYRILPIVWKHINHTNYEVDIEIGLGIKYTDEKLFLRPMVFGSIYSVGDQWRFLNIGIEVSSVTFYPGAQ